MMDANMEMLLSIVARWQMTMEHAPMSVDVAAQIREKWEAAEWEMVQKRALEEQLREAQQVRDTLAQQSPDSLAHLVPPPDQWPDNAVAWMVDSHGYFLWLIHEEERWRAAYSGNYAASVPRVELPPGFDWRTSLRMRP